MVPLVLTGWIMSDKSAKELRTVENRYQIQFVQEKARQIEMFGKSYGDLVTSISMALELSNDPKILSSEQTEKKLGNHSRQTRTLLALVRKAVAGRIFSVRRSESISNEDVQAVSLDAMITGNQSLQIGNLVLCRRGELANDVFVAGADQ